MGNKFKAPVILSLVLIVGVANAIVCPENICSMITCGEPVKKCGDNQILKQAGFCGCCKQCFTILGENQSCPYVPLLGVPQSVFECDIAAGLVCYKGTCTKLENVPTND